LRFFFIAIFGLIGVFSRYFVGSAFPFKGVNFPWSTLAINLLGCFLIGVLYVYAVEKNILSEDLRMGLMVGLLGGFTTFSAFGLESTLLIKSNLNLLAVTYVVTSSVFGIVFTFFGIAFARILTA
jgi:CrcB protein